MLRLLFRILSALPRPVRVALTRFLFTAVWKLYIKEHIAGREQIPDGPCLFICNHLSNADAPSIVRAIRPKRLFFLAGVKLQGTAMTRLGMELVDTIPIRPNSADVEALKRAVETLKSGHSVLIFPEGTRSRTGQLLRAKKGAALIARRAGVPIVPIGLWGTEQFLPINEKDMGGESIRKADVHVRIGKPFLVSDLELVVPEGEDERQVLADAMMRKVAELLPASYRGEYAE